MITDNNEPASLLALVLRRWRRVAAVLAICVLSATLYAFLVPEWYAATLTVVPSARSADSSTVALAAKLPISIDSSGDAQRIQAVLTSTSVIDEVINHFNLQELYGKQYREHTRAAVSEHCKSTSDRKSGLVSLTCEDKEPKRAMEMAAYFGQVANGVFGRISSSSAREERKFLEAQVTKARAEVDEASRKLLEFQEQNKIVDLSEQSKAVISAMAAIEGDLISKQLELSYLKSFSSRTESSVVQLEQQISILRRKLTQLELASQVQPTVREEGQGEPSFFPSALTVPGLRFALEQLLRTQKLKETVFFLLTQRFETARVDEARDTSTFQILDHPTLPTYRCRPRRARIIATGMLVGLALGFALVVLPFWSRRFQAQLRAPPTVG